MHTREQRRLESLARHLTINQTNRDSSVEILQQQETSSATTRNSKSPQDVVIVCALRTPIGKAKRGAFKETTPDILLGTVLKGVLDKTGISPSLIEDIVVGNVLQSGAGANSSRIAQLVTGLPASVPLRTVNRQCSSGLQSVADVAAAIKAGYIEIGIAAGVESMSLAQQDAPAVDWQKATQHQDAKDCMIPMGVTSEIVAEKYGISRREQDELAVASHARAALAQQNGLFDEEIVPVTVASGDSSLTVTKDEGVRQGTRLESLAKLKPAFQEGGSTTAGNSSQVSDGAAAVLLMSRKAANRLNLPVLAVFRGYQVVGVPPREMGIGPRYAIPKLLEKAGLGVSDVDIYEINEAFASQATYCVKELKIPMNKVNPKGGAIALGHPLGATGSRQIATILPELKRTGGRFGVVSMCIGTGMGAAALIERE